MAAAAPIKQDSRQFYANYHGHIVSHLQNILPALRDVLSYDGDRNSLKADDSRRRPVLWLAGDSSLDNKAWLPQSAICDAVNGYERILVPPKSVPDVAHCLNIELSKNKWLDFVAVNAAVEESTLGSRQSGKRLLPHDEFIRDNLKPEDVLLISIGGNDIALRPTLTTAAQMARLVHAASDAAIEAGTAGGLSHFVHMFGDETAAYAAALCERSKPKLVVVSMIYFPHLHKEGGSSWADPALSALKYNTNPGKLQGIMRKVYAEATCKVRVPGVRTVPCPWFKALDPSPESTDYVARVEPSVDGGRKMARFVLEIIQREYGKGPHHHHEKEESGGGSCPAAAADGGQCADCGVQ